jgi:hypothetical protein
VNSIRTEGQFGIELRVAIKNRFGSHQEEVMKIAFTSIAATAALATALTALPASVAGAQEQRQYNNDQQRQTNTQVQHPDYSKNKYYALGNREGYQDYGRKTQRPAHEHTYRNDDDRKAHDYGYQQGWQGTRGYHPDTDRR